MSLQFFGSGRAPNFLGVAAFVLAWAVGLYFVLSALQKKPAPVRLGEVEWCASAHMVHVDGGQAGDDPCRDGRGDLYVPVGPPTRR